MFAFFPFMTEAHCRSLQEHDIKHLFLGGLVFAMFLHKVQECLSVLTLLRAVKAIKSEVIEKICHIASS